jgi:1,2-diacylglycerol 3-beta-galactosyltransferase
MNRRIDLIYIDSGGGHRAAANALCEVIRNERRDWDIRLLSVQDMLDPIDFVRKYTGIPFQEVYNIMLRQGWTLGTAQMIPLMHGLIRVTHAQQVRTIEPWWRSREPDLVVSLIPHYNRSLREALGRVWPSVPFVTILTDIVDYPPHFWIERQDQFVICGSERAAGQARGLGIPPNRVLRTSGMILHPRFHAPLELDRAAERVRLGLEPDLPTGIVLFGGQGSMDMVKIARALNRPATGVQLILLRGRNEEADRRLRTLPKRIPMHIEGFTSEVPYFMALSDFFIGKPGPGSISEALAMRLPVIVERNAWTLAHERANADWVEEQSVGIVVDNFSRAAKAVSRLLTPGAYERYRANAAATRNRAVFEIPSLLEEILERRTEHQPAA